jgi:hypothetical protein
MSWQQFVACGCQTEIESFICSQAGLILLSWRDYARVKCSYVPKSAPILGGSWCENGISMTTSRRGLTSTKNISSMIGSMKEWLSVEGSVVLAGTPWGSRRERSVSTLGELSCVQLSDVSLPHHSLVIAIQDFSLLKTTTMPFESQFSLSVITKLVPL